MIFVETMTKIIHILQDFDSLPLRLYKHVLWLPGLLLPDTFIVHVHCDTNYSDYDSWPVSCWQTVD